MNRDELIAKLREQAPKYADVIAPVYPLLNWRWEFDKSGQTRDLRVPTRDDVEAFILRLIDLMGESSPQTSSGGIEVWVDVDDGGCGIRFAHEWSDYQ